MERNWLFNPQGYWNVTSLEEVQANTKKIYPLKADGLVLLKVLTGECQIRAGNRWFDLGGSHILLVDQCLESLIVSASSDLRLEVVAFTLKKGSFIGENCDQLRSIYPEFLAYCRQKPQPLLFNDTYALIAPMGENLRIFSAYKDGQERKNFIHLYINYILMVIMSAQKEESLTIAIENDYVAKALVYIEKHYMSTLSVSTIAEAVGVHPGYLHKIFLEHTGKRINEYIMKKRVKYIKFLLIHTDFSMKKIAELTGIASVQYLSRVFKSHVGLSPQVFRAKRDITCFYDQFLKERAEESL